MWVRFERFAGHIFPDRTAFYYQPGSCYDLPEEWCAEWVTEMGGDGSATIAEPPGPPPMDWSRIPPWLGEALLTVACVRRSGGVYDRVDYVGPLARAVARNLGAPHRFVCLSDRPDVPDGVEHIPLVHGWPGFWSKVELFRPGLFAGPVLYLDLDTIVCGDITDIATAGTDPLLITWDMQHGWINSSFVRWSVDLGFVYDALCADPAGVMRKYESGGLWGDQGLLQDQLMSAGVAWRWAQDAFPERIRWHQPGARALAAEPGTAISLWYGHPKPHEVTSEFVAQHWR